MNRFEKLKIALRYYLLGKGYDTALAAFAFAQEYHVNLRKDKVTPELQHQLEIALYITTLKGVIDEQRAICVALLHDVLEDYDVVCYNDLVSMFGNDIADDVMALSKYHRGTKIHDTDESYFKGILARQYSALVKGVDRINNLQSMVGVFTIEKQKTYVEEAEKMFLPMLRNAERAYPCHFYAFMNIRTMLKNQIALITAAHEALT